VRREALKEGTIKHILGIVTQSLTAAQTTCIWDMTWEIIILQDHSTVSRFSAVPYLIKTSFLQIFSFTRLFHIKSNSHAGYLAVYHSSRSDPQLS
jgi:hypothetical protein